MAAAAAQHLRAACSAARCAVDGCQSRAQARPTTALGALVGARSPLQPRLWLRQQAHQPREPAVPPQRQQRRRVAAHHAAAAARGSRHVRGIRQDTAGRGHMRQGRVRRAHAELLKGAAAACLSGKAFQWGREHGVCFHREHGGCRSGSEKRSTCSACSTHSSAQRAQQPPHLRAITPLVCTVALLSPSRPSSGGMMPPSMKAFCKGGVVWGAGTWLRPAGASVGLERTPATPCKHAPWLPQCQRCASLCRDLRRLRHQRE